MIDDSGIRNVMLDTLDNRVSSIAYMIASLVKEGYLPNKNKYNVLTFASILTEAYNNVHLYNEEQLNKLNNLYNKIIAS